MGADDANLSKIMFFLKTVSAFILIIHLYYFAYPFAKSIGITNVVFNEVIFFFKKTGFLNSLWISKIAAFILIAASIIADRGKKSQETNIGTIILISVVGIGFYFASCIFYRLSFLYVCLSFIGYVLVIIGASLATCLLKNKLLSDPFNTVNESFMQETRKLVNPDSVNIPTEFIYQKKKYNGWINIVNPFRGTMVTGSAGSGKTYSVGNNFIKQEIEKGFCLYIYDFKFPTLSKTAYNHLCLHPNGYKVTPKFYVINFDDARRSHRGNPIHPSLMMDITDANDAAEVVMESINRTWAQKQGDFFPESAKTLLASFMWFLRIYTPTGKEEDCGKYCTFPHVIDLLSVDYSKTFPILASYSELSNQMAPFVNAWKAGANEQLQGQIASVQIPLGRIVSDGLYWVMSGDDFTLDLNNPEEPKILCIGNNPKRKKVYSSVLSLYNSQIIKTINQEDKEKCGIIVDETPTIYFKGIDDLMNTARSNRVAVCLLMQDFSQIRRDYGKEESTVIINAAGNVITGQVLGDSATYYEKRFGKIVQIRQNISVNKNDTSVSYNTGMAEMIPAAKISSLTQGVFCGAVTDNVGQEIEQKNFHSRILIDNDKLREEEKKYTEIPQITYFIDKDGKDIMKDVLKANRNKIRNDVEKLVYDELERISADPKLARLL